MSALLVVGYDLPSSRAAVELARAHPIVARQRRHPPQLRRRSLRRPISRPSRTLARARSRHRHRRDRAGQLSHLHAARAPARRPGLAPAAWPRSWTCRSIVHNRQADADVAAALVARARGRSMPGVLHCFSSTDPRYLDRMLEAGYCVSFAGPLTYKSAARPARRWRRASRSTACWSRRTARTWRPRARIAASATSRRSWPRPPACLADVVG